MLQLFDNASGFVFDCDGTLLDTMRIWDQVEEEMVSATGVEFDMPMYEEIRSAPIDQTARIFHDRYGLMGSWQEVLDYMDSRLLGFYRDAACALPGTREFVAELRRSGVPCCVVTSSPARYVTAGLERNGLLDCMQTVVCTDDVRLSKQDPAIFHLAMQRMGSDAATTWGADDSLYAVKVMRQAGMRTIGAYDGEGTGPYDELVAAADIVVRSFEELLG